MKKLHLILGCAAVAAACTGEPFIPDATTGPEVPAGYHMETLLAGYPAETRTSFDTETGSFAWTDGDLLAFHLSEEPVRGLSRRSGRSRTCRSGGPDGILSRLVRHLG